MSEMHPTATVATGGLAARALKPALMAGGLIAIAFCVPLLGAGSAQAELISLVSQSGVRGPLMFLGLASLLTAIGLPRQIPAFVAGYAFGAWNGAAIALISQLAACAIDFFWARAVARNLVRRRLGGTLRKIDSALAARPFMATLTFRLMPVGSNILLNLAAGLSSVRALPFLAASSIGFIPQTVIFALIGRGSSPTHGHVLMIGCAMFLASAALGVLLLQRSRQSLA